MAGLRALAASTLLLAVPAVPAAATPDDTTFVVNSVEDDGDLADDDECETGEGDTPTCTLRAAIEQASNGTGATITFDPSLAGETIEVSDELLATQPIVLEGPDGGVTIAAADDFEHDSVLVVRAAGSAVRDVAFDGNDVARGLHVAVEEAEINTFDAPAITAPNDPDLLLDGATVTNGYTDSQGGGILLEGPLAAHLQGVTISQNHADEGGGGLAAVDATVFAENLVVTGNAGGFGGGVLALDSLATLLDAQLEGNEALLGGGAALVAFETPGSMHFEGSTIAENAAMGGGGVMNIFGGLVLRDTDVTANTANGSMISDAITRQAETPMDEGFGGGIATFGGRDEGGSDQAPPRGELLDAAAIEEYGPGITMVLGGHVAENTAAGYGGGIFAAGGLVPVLLRETRVTGNDAGGDGGGIWTGVPDAEVNRLAQGIRDEAPAELSETPRPEDVLPAFPASLDIRRSDISGNTSAGNGGGIATAGDYLHLSRTSVTGNVAGEAGGGIWRNGRNSLAYPNDEPVRPMFDLPNVVHATTLSGNTAGTTGGAVHQEDLGLWGYANSTIAGNAAATGPALHLRAPVILTEEHASPTSALLFGTIVADHAAPACTTEGAAQYYEGSEGQSANVFEDEGGTTASCDGPEPQEGGDFLFLAPQMGPNAIVPDAGLTELVSGVDLTAYHLLEPTSAAVDRVVTPDEPAQPADEHEDDFDPCLGQDFVFEPEYSTHTDQRLAPRPVDGDGDGEARCDSGAVEFQGAVAVTATTDGAEPSTDGSVTISRTGPVDTDMVVPMTVTGTATPGTDYVALPDSVTIPAGESDVVVPVEVIDDELDEDTETVEVTITRPEGTDPVGGPLSGTVAIIDDDVPSGPGSEAIQLGGPTRIDTAVAVSNSQFEAGSSPVVLLATARVYADALAASPLAGQLDASLLLTEQDHLPGQTADEIGRLGSTRAIILGGTDAVSAGVADDLTARGLSVDRIGGADRFVTATLIFERLVDELEADGDMPTDGLPVLVTEGANPDPSRGWPDAMSASFVAAKGTMPILLTLADALPQVTADALAGGDVADATLIGGPVAISTTVEDAIADRVPTTRVSGDTRYGTGVAIVEQLAEPLGLNTDRVWLATGNEFVDGLVAGPAAARDDAILLLIDGANPDGATEVHTLLAELAPHRVVFVGGDAAIAPAVQAKVAGHQP